MVPPRARGADGSFEDAELVDLRSPTGEIMDGHLAPLRSNAADARARNKVVSAAPAAVEIADYGVEQVVHSAAPGFSLPAAARDTASAPTPRRITTAAARIATT